MTTVFEGRVWLVSKCGPRVQQRSLRWLEAHDFSGRTGIPTAHVRFCRARADKRRHCDELDLTHFVDDRPEVHAAIRGSVDHQYLFGPQTAPVPPYTRAVRDWAETERLVLATLSEPGPPSRPGRPSGPTAVRR